MTQLELVKGETVDAEIVDGASLPELAAAANRWHTVANQAAQSTIKAAIAAGQALNDAKAQVKREHGRWLPWLAENFAADSSTARRYMQIANCARVHNLEFEADTSLREALRTIQRNSRPRPEPKAKPERDRKADRAAAIDALRDSRTGRINAMTIAELISEMTAPSTFSAGWLADAIATHWGSWAAFEKDRKAYNTQRVEQQTRNTKAIFGK